MLERIFDLILQIWEQERMLEEWEIGVICPIFKKGDRRECSNYRGITLLNTVRIQNVYAFNIQQTSKILRADPR
jgi:sorting nexin-29